MTDIILASASPRRAQLLDQIDITYQIQVVDIDETPLPEEIPENLVKRLAIEKSQALPASHIPVLGADTLGVIDGELLLKPDDFKHAHQMLSQMSGNWHEILSAVAISFQGRTEVLVNRNWVLFRRISSEEIKTYWNTGEPKGKAGAYAIQGLAATFIERIEGSYSGIMGLPLFETANLLAELGVNVFKEEY